MYTGIVKAPAGDFPVLVQINMPNDNYPEFGPVRIGYKPPGAKGYFPLFFSSQKYSFVRPSAGGWNYRDVVTGLIQSIDLISSHGFRRNIRFIAKRSLIVSKYL